MSSSPCRACSAGSSASGASFCLDLAQCVAEAVVEYVKRQVGADVRPGIVISIASAGDLLQWHPHDHILVTDGAFSNEGALHPLETCDSDAVMKLFRARRLLAWRHPGFSAHVGKAIPFEDKKAIEDVACYVVRNPLSLKKLVHLDGQKAVLYRSRMNPSLGRNFEAMDPLEWLARRADHIPDAGKHRTHFYAHYANGVRGERPSEKLGHQKHEEEQLKKRRCSPSWARLIAKAFQTDPLVCRRCGGSLKVVAYITNTVAIRRILDHLGLSPPGEPPPELREVLRVPVDDQGREIGAGPA